jgi:thymidylate kinase
MIIEFCGLPGSGKTTIAKKIEQNTDYKIIKIKSKRELLYYNFLFFIKYPVKFFYLFFYICRNSESWKEFYLKLMNTFFQHNAKYQKALKFEKAIIDQGYFQNFLSVFNKKINTDIFYKYSELILQPDKLFIIKVSEKERLERINKRGYSFRNDFSEEERGVWMKIMMSNNSLLEKEVDNHKNWLLVENNNLDKAIKEIL